MSAAPTNGLDKLQFHERLGNASSTDGGGGCTKSTCTKGALLALGSKLISPSGQYYLDMQTDGNLVILCGERAIWDTGTNGMVIRDGLVFQGDGNLCLYRSDGKPLWCSMTNGRPVNVLPLQDDGNLVLYNGGRAYWSSGTAGAC